MSKNFKIKSSIHDYSVHFIDDFESELIAQCDRDDILLIDANIYSLYRKRFESIKISYKRIIIEPSEENKSYQNVGTILEKIIESGFRKNNKIIAIGGGITQDIATFIAANIYRGVEWIFFPTTLLAQADSCIGGKSSVNFQNFKNLLGNFYPPYNIFIYSGFLSTLPQKEIISGLGEMTHFYFIAGETDFEMINDQMMRGLPNDSELEKLVSRSLEIKKERVEIDEFDRKERQVFNYGHSFGHAIETMTKYRVPHGIAVSHGMDIANFISVKMNLIDSDLRKKMRDVLVHYWKEIPLGHIDVESFINALRKDKKNVGQQVRVILTRGLGDMFVTSLDVDGKPHSWIIEYFRDQVHKG